MSDYLPNDVWIGILKWLPIKPLGRCMLVCKSWYTLISSPHFISENLNHVYKTQFLSGHNSPRPPCALDDELQCYVPRHITDDNYVGYEPPFSDRKCEVVGNVNGLICICIYLFPYDPIIILWNPTIQKILALPRPNLTFSSCGKPYLDSFGFGYDRINNDFKIVRIVQFTDEWMKFHQLPRPTTEDSVVPPIIELFKVSTGQWQVLNNVILPFQIDRRRFYSHLNGNLHWVGYGEENRDAIVVFNLSKDEFSLMMLPDYILSLGQVKRVDVFREHLALLIFEYSDYLTMWIMRSYGDSHSWSLNQPIYKCNSCVFFALPSGVDLEALATDHQFSVSVDREDMKVTLHQNSCFVPKLRFYTDLLSLWNGIPTIRIHMELSPVHEGKLGRYMGAFYESLALLDKGISLRDSVTCSIMPRQDETEEVMQPERVANDTKSVPCVAKKKKNAKLSEYVASLIKKNLLCNRF